MEATPQQAAEGLAIVRVLSAVLDRLVIANAPIARADPGAVTKFHAMKAPGITIQQYLERIHKYASCSNECFILALIYIDRLIQRSNFLLTELNVHRVVITAVLLAAKFFDDAYYNNAYYAKVGGVLVSEMNGLEVDFLFRINFSLHVTPEVFGKYRAELMMHSITAVPITPVTQSPLQVAAQQLYNTPIANPMAAAPVVSAHDLVAVAAAAAAAAQITPAPPAADAVLADEIIRACAANAVSADVALAATLPTTAAAVVPTIPMAAPTFPLAAAPTFPIAPTIPAALPTLATVPSLPTLPTIPVEQPRVPLNASFDSFMPVTRANSLPPIKASTFAPFCMPQQPQAPPPPPRDPFSAPAAYTFPPDDPFVMLGGGATDQSLFPLQSKLLGLQARDTYAQHLVGTRMLAGVSGGAGL